MIRRGFLGLAASAAVLPKVAFAAEAASRATRPIEDFAALPFIAGPEVSPDGTQIACKIAANGQQYFAIVPLGEGRPKLVMSGEQDINWWSWVNNEWLVVGIGAMDKLYGEEFYVSRVVGVRADAQKMVPLAFRDAAQSAGNVIWIASDGTPRVRLTVQKSMFADEEGFWPEVLEVDVSTGKTKHVVGPQRDVMHWYADAAGNVRIGIGHTNEGRSARLMYRDTDGGTFKIVDRANSRKGQSLLVPSVFLPEPGQALAVDSKEGFDAVYKLDLKTMALGEKVFGATGYDIDGMVLDPKDKRLVGTIVTENHSRVRWLDPDLAAVQAELDRAVGERRATIASYNPDRSVFIVHVGGADRPGTYYLMTSAGGALQKIAYVNPRIGAGKLHPVKTVRYKARDGLEMTGVLTLPSGRPAKDLPVVVMPHGGPFARDAEEWDWWSEFLAERGYAVIKPNYRGSSGFGTAFAEKGEGQWGLAMQDDLNDALAFLAKEGIADPKRACMVGASYGGYAAMRAAQRDGSLYRCAVSFAGVSDLPALKRYDSGFLNSGRSNDWLEEQAPNLKAVSPINFPQQFSIPILLVHGKADLRVPVKQSREMAEKLKKAGKTVRYVEQPAGDHHFSREEDRVSFLKELELFLKQHNPA
ncbi:MAG TPA: S9 family peptidase [Allosphingosinicella sp.]|jgi:dienelactone hydrolase|nr:S9 family peptidase [Allosphingosinicella sp.]